ncbi:MAG: hypothetical protein Ct9H300mP6_15780 [Gammaproteobacteria bacterium]|nr:MAG: hypothetical protein Ct9H300mP6_15780 [Gammaproteobacteria bacterium]
MLDRSGVETGVDLRQVVKTTDWLEEQLGRPYQQWFQKLEFFQKMLKLICNKSIIILLNNKLNKFYRLVRFQRSLGIDQSFLFLPNVKKIWSYYELSTRC